MAVRENMLKVNSPSETTSEKEAMGAGRREEVHSKVGRSSELPALAKHWSPITLQHQDSQLELNFTYKMPCYCNTLRQ
jgi:hypothetical protein